jgi:hypothetical protein
MALAGLLLSGVPTTADSGQTTIRQKQPGKHLAGAKKAPPMLIVTTRTDSEVEREFADLLCPPKGAELPPNTPPE